MSLNITDVEKTLNCILEECPVTDVEYVGYEMEEDYDSVSSKIIELKGRYRVLILEDIYDIPLILRKDATIDDVYDFLANFVDLTEEEIEGIEYYYEKEEENNEN